MVKNLPASEPKAFSFQCMTKFTTKKKKRIFLPMQEMQEMPVRSLGQEDPLEKEMATHSSTLAWEILWTEEPGGLQSMGLWSQAQLSD